MLQPSARASVTRLPTSSRMLSVTAEDVLGHGIRIHAQRVQRELHRHAEARPNGHRADWRSAALRLGAVDERAFLFRAQGCQRGIDVTEDIGIDQVVDERYPSDYFDLGLVVFNGLGHPKIVLTGWHGGNRVCADTRRQRQRIATAQHVADPLQGTDQPVDLAQGDTGWRLGRITLELLPDGATRNASNCNR